MYGANKHVRQSVLGNRLAHLQTQKSPWQARFQGVNICPNSRFEPNDQMCRASLKHFETAVKNCSNLPNMSETFGFQPTAPFVRPLRPRDVAVVALGSVHEDGDRAPVVGQRRRRLMDGFIFGLVFEEVPSQGMAGRGSC